MDKKDVLAVLKSNYNAQGIAFESNVLLQEHCTFRIGGPAALFVEPKGIAQLRAAVSEAYRLQVPWFVLGKGSNVLFSDSGYSGVVLHIGTGLANMYKTDEQTIFCESGASLSSLCVYACEQGLAGLEFAYGIPGSVGGAVYMNAGAYGGEMKDVLVRTMHLEPDGTAGSFEGEDMQLSYRHSAYTNSDRVITGSYIRLAKGDPETIRAKMNDFMQRRRSKQPLEYPSAGSTFRRPEGAYASALIDDCGLKGTQIGGAMVSPKHAGFVINTGEATCQDVQELIRHIQQVVQDKTGFALSCEVKIIK